MLVFGIPEAWYKSSQFGAGGVLMDVVYFTLLFILIVLFVFAITFAQYLRRKDKSSQNSDQIESDGSSPPNCTCALSTLAQID